MSAIGSIVPFPFSFDCGRLLRVDRLGPGLKRARAEGKALGRPLRLDGTRRQQVLEELKKGASISVLARNLLRAADDHERTKFAERV